MTKHVGVLTAGGDSPGLNAVLRGIGKAALEFFSMEVVFWSSVEGSMKKLI